VAAEAALAEANEELSAANAAIEAWKDARETWVAEANQQARDLADALRALLEWAEKDRGGGYPEADRSEEWYTHRDFARAALEHSSDRGSDRQE
jgi:hypothetical protein